MSLLKRARLVALTGVLTVTGFSLPAAASSPLGASCHLSDQSRALQSSQHQAGGNISGVTYGDSSVGASAMISVTAACTSTPSAQAYIPIAPPDLNGNPATLAGPMFTNDVLDCVLSGPAGPMEFTNDPTNNNADRIPSDRTDINQTPVPDQAFAISLVQLFGTTNSLAPGVQSPPAGQPVALPSLQAGTYTNSCSLKVFYTTTPTLLPSGVTGAPTAAELDYSDNSEFIVQ